MPAEWEPHEATWISWPWNSDDWPEKFAAISWVYAEIVRLLAASEPVEIIVRDQAQREHAARCLAAHQVPEGRYRLHEFPTDRSWVRDSGPTGVYVDNRLQWTDWHFNAWAKYENFTLDNQVPTLFERVTGAARSKAFRTDNGAPFVCEGGAIDCDGEGTLLVTEECFLSHIQERNPGLTREGYEAVFQKHLGIEKVIWLGAGCHGDDTHGHIDDVARFVAPGKVVLAFESNPNDPNHAPSVENLKRLQAATDAAGRRLEVHCLPMPKPMRFLHYDLPASYANFYIGNSVVLVPTFNDENDRQALTLLSELFPTRKVVGVHSVDLVLGLGTLHCLTQQQPAARR
jgi:agmatine deiminase